MKIQNLSLRKTILEKGITYRLIAKRLGITPQWLCVLMSRPLTDEMHQKIKDIVMSENGGADE